MSWWIETIRLGNCNQKLKLSINDYSALDLLSQPSLMKTYLRESMQSWLLNFFWIFSFFFSKRKNIYLLEVNIMDFKVNFSLCFTLTPYLPWMNRIFIDILNILKLWLISFQNKKPLRKFLKMTYFYKVILLSLIHIWRCRRYSLCRSRWSPYH